MCLICATTTKISSIIQKIRNKRKRARIFKRMQQQDKKILTPVALSRIETFNAFSPKGGK